MYRTCVFPGRQKRAVGRRGPRARGAPLLASWRASARESRRWAFSPSVSAREAADAAADSWALRLRTSARRADMVSSCGAQGRGLGVQKHGGGEVEERPDGCISVYPAVRVGVMRGAPVCGRWRGSRPPPARPPSAGVPGRGSGAGPGLGGEAASRAGLVEQASQTTARRRCLRAKPLLPPSPRLRRGPHQALRERRDQVVAPRPRRGRLWPGVRRRGCLRRRMWARRSARASWRVVRGMLLLVRDWACVRRMNPLRHAPRKRKADSDSYSSWTCFDPPLSRRI